MKKKRKIFFTVFRGIWPGNDSAHDLSPLADARARASVPVVGLGRETSRPLGLGLGPVNLYRSNETDSCLRFMAE
jgi:hypothetical protein